MADIRTLLRHELATRKGSAVQTGTTGNRITKKRKVDIGDDLTRKKIKPAAGSAKQEASHAIQPPSAQAIEDDAEKDTAGPELPSEPEVEQQDVDDTNHQMTQSANELISEGEAQAVDEDEWAAFEREVAAPSRVPQAPAAVAAPATISAAPMTAEQISEQQEKEKETTHTREAQVEGEREDAARLLEDEFEEMEQLEERVRRLKQKREELRAKRASEEADETPPPATVSNEQEADAGSAIDDDDDDDDDDDWDDWRFR